MSRLDVLYDITKKIKKILDQSITTKNREAIIEEVTVLIAERGQVMENLTPPFSEQEKLQGKQIVVLNKQIEKEMESLFDILKQDIRQVNKQKESSRSYINPYGNIKSTDGMYLDSKQ
jgi:flagellar protein FliT